MSYLTFVPIQRRTVSAVLRSENLVVGFYLFGRQPRCERANFVLFEPLTCSANSSKIFFPAKRVGRENAGVRTLSLN